MFDDVIRRLEVLGLDNARTMPDLIRFSIEKVTETVKNKCNTPAIPLGMRFAAVDMVCGEVLFLLKGTGKLTGFDVEGAVKQLQEGDTNITYAIPDAVITVDGFIDMLRRAGESQYAAFRRFKW